MKSSQQDSRNSANKKNNPFNQLPALSLCEDCQQLGYCKKARVGNTLPITMSKLLSFDIKTYQNMVPLNAGPEYRIAADDRKLLQTGYDAFHQDDFETALLNFKAVGYSNHKEVPISFILAVTYFMLEDFENAALRMDQLHFGYFSIIKQDLINRFIEECEIRERQKQVINTTNGTDEQETITQKVILVCEANSHNP